MCTDKLSIALLFAKGAVVAYLVDISVVMRSTTCDLEDFPEILQLRMVASNR